MKIISFIIIAVLGPCTLFAQKSEEVKWYTIQEAQELTKKTPRKILIDVYTDWCGWCKVMDKETFSHPVIAKYLNENYYPVKFNAESKDPVVFAGQTFINEGQGQRPTHQLAGALLNGQLSYPSIVYVTEKLELIGAVPGFYNAERIEPLLHFIIEEKYKDKMTLEEYQKTFVGSIKK